jgi:hypothetical protein
VSSGYNLFKGPVVPSELLPKLPFNCLQVLLLLSIAGSLFAVSIPITQAAPLTYSTTENITLTSPGITFTIAAGSSADALQVNATSVVVTLSSSTGGSFTLTSTAYNLTIASSSSGGTASLSCTPGTASVTLSQSTNQTTYTITPAASQCTTPSNSGGSGGGGGGGGSVGVAASYAPPGWQIGSGSATGTSGTVSSSTATVSAATSSTDLEAELQSLLALLANLEAQAAKQGIAAPGSARKPSPFTIALHLGMSGQSVTRLPEFLAKDPAIYPEGKVSGYFGTLTLQAVQRFQKKYGIANAANPGYGYVGPATRATLNSLFEADLIP